MTLFVQEHVALAPLTTFKIGGPARYFAEVKTEDNILEALKFAKDKDVPFIILAGGSNVLVPDEGLDAMVIRLVDGTHSFAGTELSADAGCNLLSLIRDTAKQELGGWEKLSGIPGTVGGAARGNAGAFGMEMKDVITRIRALNIYTGEICEFGNTECTFAYRQSFFKQNFGWMITRVYIKLKQTARAESERLITKTIAEREKRHLQNVRAAGSYFMNPVVPKEIQEIFKREKGLFAREGRVPAGWLIEKAGMKGAIVGDAQASEQHPNYLVNMGTATSKDVRELARRVRQAVLEQFGIELQEEVVVL